MKIIVAGKGGVGKTTLSGTLARALGRAGHRVLALDADTNPMLGVSLGLGAENTDLLQGVRQGLESGTTEHERSTEGFVERFGRDAPDGVRLVVATRIDRPNPGCMCCGVSPESLMRELEGNGVVVVGDLEAGIGTMWRLNEADADVVLVVVQPTAKSIEVARRALELASERVREVIVVANRIREDDDLEMIREALGHEYDYVLIPEDAVIGEADRRGEAAIDIDDHAPGVLAIVALADRLAGVSAPA
ncbi:MAG: cobyrinic acid ac-diamide synthase [Solirubrobacterales bacterium]|nr:cobyrinic acid ac-diamide synthase [Solirubrobacterales bacterium]